MPTPVSTAATVVSLFDVIAVMPHLTPAARQELQSLTWAYCLPELMSEYASRRTADIATLQRWYEQPVQLELPFSDEPTQQELPFS